MKIYCYSKIAFLILILVFFIFSSLYAQDNLAKGLNFEKVDACAKDKTYFREKNIERLAKALNRCARQGLPNKILDNKYLSIYKARAITVWMAENFVYDYDKKGNPNNKVSNAWERNTDVETILKNREIICEGYASFFKALADSMGLTARKVIGFVNKDPEAGHAWNAFEVPDIGWYLVDVTWFDHTEKPVYGKMSFREQMEKKSKLVKTINDATNKEKAVYSYTEKYFMPDPAVFIQDHFPNNPEYQLIDPPIKKDDYLSSK